MLSDYILHINLYTVYYYYYYYYFFFSVLYNCHIWVLHKYNKIHISGEIDFQDDLHLAHGNTCRLSVSNTARNLITVYLPYFALRKHAFQIY